MRLSELKENEFNHFYTLFGNMVDEEDRIDGTITEWLCKLYSSMEFLMNKLHYAYGEGKWTVAEVLIHIIDTERIFQYRAFRFSRNDQTPLMGFDQDEYVLENLKVKVGTKKIL